MSADPFPVVKWVSIANGGRTADDALEDKAASYLATQNTLFVNADFRVFNDMIARLAKEKDTGLGPPPAGCRQGSCPSVVRTGPHRDRDRDPATEGQQGMDVRVHR